MWPVSRLYHLHQNDKIALTVISSVRFHYGVVVVGARFYSETNLDILTVNLWWNNDYGTCVLSLTKTRL